MSRGEPNVRRLVQRGQAATATIAARVLDDLDAVVERLGPAYCEVPAYAAMKPEVLTHEVLPTSRRIIEGFFAPMAAGGEPDVTALETLPEMGRRRLDMGIPLEPMLHVYRIAGRVVWDAIVAATDADDGRALADLGARWMDYIDRAATLAAAAYLAASHDRIRHIDARRRALLEALLAANDTGEVAAVSVRFSTVLAPAYVPVVVEGAAAGIDAALGAAPEGTIGGHRGGRLLLLVPDRLDDVAALHRAVGKGPMTWGEPAAPGPELLREVGHAESTLAAARARGITHGAYGPDDLLLEQLLAASPRVEAALRRRVRDRLAGRDHDGLITATLRTYLACGSIPETARQELVHANTVLYRLNRAKALTGLDPRVPADAALLVLALGVGGDR